MIHVDVPSLNVTAVRLPAALTVIVPVQVIAILSVEVVVIVTEASVSKKPEVTPQMIAVAATVSAMRRTTAITGDTALFLFLKTLLNIFLFTNLFDFLLSNGKIGYLT